MKKNEFDRSDYDDDVDIDLFRMYETMMCVQIENRQRKELIHIKRIIKYI